MKSALLLLIPIFALASCETSKTCVGEVEKVTWNLSGSGSAALSITPVGPNYQTQLERWDVASKNVSRTLTPADGKAYALVQSIFSKRRDLSQDSFIMPKGASGISNSITLNCAGGSQASFNNITSGSDLWAIRDFAVGGTGTGTGTEPNPEPNKPDIAFLVWETRGGGDCRFSITPQGHEFKIHLVRYQGVGQNFDVTLSALDGAAYTLVQSVFAGTRDLQAETMGLNPGAASGTWTTITLVGGDGKSNKISNISPTGDLNSIYQFVSARAKP